MGAFSTHHVDFSKGYPSMYAVDHAAPVKSTEQLLIVEGMGIHLNDDGEWVRGCPAGKLPFITGQAQFPLALDVARNTNEMGGGKMGGVALSQGLAFDTTEFTGDPSGRYVSCGVDGLFIEAGEGDQITGWCSSAFNDAYGDAVARIFSCVGPSLGDGYSSLSSESLSSQEQSSVSPSSVSDQSTASTASSPSSVSSPSSQSESSPSSVSDQSTASSPSSESSVSTQSDQSTDSSAST